MVTIWIVIITLGFSAFFSGMEIAFVSSNRLKQELDMKRNIYSARLLSEFYNNPSRFIGALLLGNNVALVIYGMATAAWLEPVIRQHLPVALQSEFIVLLTQTILSTLLILIVAEFLPKIFFRLNPNAILKSLALPVWVLYYLLYPLIFIYIGVAEFILQKIFRVKINEETYTFSAFDLDEYVKNFRIEDQDTEELNQEMQMIQNAMEFKNVKLRDCMIPRTEIIALEINESVDILRKMFTETGHSKIMIYKENIDNLQAYVHAYDMFCKPKKIGEVVRPVDVYPETMAAKELLNLFIQNHKSVAVVVDEFGGTSGMVTMEDIIEEIFGEIEDEYDLEEEVEKQISHSEYVFSARMEIDYINEKYKLNIPVSEEYETLAGFIIHHYKSIPCIDEKISIIPFRFTITKASDNRLEEVHLVVEN